MKTSLASIYPSTLKAPSCLCAEALGLRLSQHSDHHSPFKRKHRRVKDTFRSFMCPVSHFPLLIVSKKTFRICHSSPVRTTYSEASREPWCPVLSVVFHIHRLIVTQEASQNPMLCVGTLSYDRKFSVTGRHPVCDECDVSCVLC